jgi:hypothetical protein
MEKKKPISSYVLTWIEFVADKGKPLKSDVIKISGYSHILHALDRNGNYYKCFPNKSDAIRFLQSFNKKLKKRYICHLFSDKQFGMRTSKDNYAVPYTKMQLENVYYI